MIFRKLTILILMISGGFCLPAPLATAGEIGAIQVSELNMRAGPGISYDVVTRLPKEARVRVVAYEKDWVKIERNGLEGYIRNRPRFIRITVLDEGGTAQKNALGQGELKNLEQEAETIQEKLKASKNDLAVIDQKEQEILRAFNATEKALNVTRQQVHAAEAGLEDLLKKIDGIEKQSAELEEQITVNAAYASKRLVALYKLNWIGRVQLLATADSFFDFINRKAALESVLRQDETLLEKLRRDRTTLESLFEQLNTSKAEKHALELSLKERLQQLKAEQAKRTELMDTIRGKKSLARAALVSLQEAARELDDTIRIMGQAPISQPLPVQTITESKAFDTYKGLLSWPVRGKIISFYGPYQDDKYDVMNFQSGIEIQAERGEPIRAVSEGYAIFSSWFKGFGNMLIIDHGDHFYTVYAHLEEVFKVKGDRVDKGEVVATVGDTGSLSGPALHFEVRHRGKPLDPLKWIKKG